MAKIMLVEDDNNLREIYGARLLAEGYEIVSAKDGEEALAIAVKEKPDLIISDVMMPRISGFDMLDILRNAPETKFTKVIMMTALSQAEDKARADSLGADRYLVKSQVTLEDVARVVKDVLEGKGESAATNTPAEPPTPAVSTEPVAATPEPTPNPVAEAPAVPETPPASDPIAAPTPASDPAAADDPAPVMSTLPPEPAAQAVVTQDDATPAPQASDQSTVTPVAPTTDVEATVVPVSAPEEVTPTPAIEAPADPEPEPTPPPADPVPASTTIKVELPPEAQNNEAASSVSPESAPTPEPEISTQVPAASEDASSDDPSRKKIVIQPLNDITKGPDLDALVAKEEADAPISNPGVDSVIQPGGEVQAPEAPAQPKNDHDNIAL